VRKEPEMAILVTLGSISAVSTSPIYSICLTNRAVSESLVHSETQRQQEVPKHPTAVRLAVRILSESQERF
jgi:hypothetical protein